MMERQELPEDAHGASEIEIWPNSYPGIKSRLILRLYKSQGKKS